MFSFLKRENLSETERQVQDVVTSLKDPLIDKTFKASQVIECRVKSRRAILTLMLDYAIDDASVAEMESSIGTSIINHIEVIQQVEVTIAFEVQGKSVQQGVKRYDEVKNIIAVASGKGGAGKSTVAVNLACALKQAGAKVGVLDVDIYGPSVPAMLGVSGIKPTSPDKKHFLPIEAHGLQVMSMGFLIGKDDTAIAWRGAMLNSAVQQLAGDTLWSDLDYLIVDMPPGTGDVPLTMGSKIPVSGAVVVTTPQNIALLDAKKGLTMFEKINIDVLGIVENMSAFICPNCDHETHLFGQDGGQLMADTYDVPLLGTLPLDISIRQHGDNGLPIVLAEPDSLIAEKYRRIATQMVAKLSLKKKDFSAIMPTVVVQSDDDSALENKNKKDEEPNS